MMGKPITMDQLRQDVGVMVEKITHVTLMFRRVKLRMEEYVCLKVIIMLTQSAWSLLYYYIRAQILITVHLGFFFYFNFFNYHSQPQITAVPRAS